MRNLFDEAGLCALDAFCMANTLFAFDYDGTLAPIVDDPKLAFMRTRTTQLILGISRFAPVALISGRARGDVSTFIPDSIEYVIGNHGLEGLTGGTSSLELAETSCQRWAKSLDQKLSLEGVSIENKTYSLAIHYRKSPDKRKAKSEILNIITNLDPPPRIIMGKCVVNLISPGAPHKGVALLEIMLRSGCRSAVYFGDDDNDEDVFTLGEESLLTVRVGKSETSAALFYLDAQSDVDYALEKCLASLERSGKTPRDANDLGEFNETRTH